MFNFKSTNYVFTFLLKHINDDLNTKEANNVQNSKEVKSKNGVNDN